MRVWPAVLLATACTHHHPVTTLLPVSPSSEATAQLGDGRVVVVRAAPTPEGPRWMEQGEPHARTSVIVENADLRSYATVSHGRGAVEGSVSGGLGGVAVGALLGLASGDDKCSEQSFCLFKFSAGTKAVLGGAVLGGFGAALGALFGALTGSRDVYELDSSSGPRVTTTIGPGRAGAGLSWSF